jgi:hypothetical protein
MCFDGILMNSTIFWDIAPCGPLKVDRRFGGLYRLHIQSGIPEDSALHNHCCEYLKSKILMVFHSIYW